MKVYNNIWLVHHNKTWAIIDKDTVLLGENITISVEYWSALSEIVKLTSMQKTYFDVSTKVLVRIR